MYVINMKSIYKKSANYFRRNKKGMLSHAFFFLLRSYYNFGPAATNALPASLPVNLAKFLMKRPAKSLAFSSH